MKKAFFVLTIALALQATIVTVVCAADREWLHYNELLAHTYLGKFYAVPADQRDRVRMRGLLKPNNKAIKPADVVLTIVAKDGAEVIHVDADGNFDLPNNPQWVKQNPMILTNLPAGEKSAIGFNAFAVLPVENHVSYSVLMSSVTQANQLVNALAGMLSVFAPKFDGIEVQFSKPAQQNIQLLTKAGPQLLNVTSKGVIRLKLDSELMREDPQVVFSEHATIAELTTK